MAAEAPAGNRLETPRRDGAAYALRSLYVSGPSADQPSEVAYCHRASGVRVLCKKLAALRLRLLSVREKTIVRLQRRLRHSGGTSRRLTIPHYSAWLCIHRYEGSWTDSGDPYWGGLQMDRSFMQTYAPRWLLARGWANVWTPREQMWVAERAWRSRGFSPWPNTARMCGLL